MSSGMIKFTLLFGQLAGGREYWPFKPNGDLLFRQAGGLNSVDSREFVNIPINVVHRLPRKFPNAQPYQSFPYFLFVSNV